MKKLIFIFMLVVGLIQGICFAQDKTPEQKTVPVKKEHKEFDPYGKRIPSLSIMCVISREDGVELPGVLKEEIISFEVFDTNGTSIALFYEEADFIEFFFSDSYISIGGVRFETADYYFSGSI